MGQKYHTTVCLSWGKPAKRNFNYKKKTFPFIFVFHGFWGLLTFADEGGEVEPDAEFCWRGGGGQKSHILCWRNTWQFPLLPIWDHGILFPSFPSLPHSFTLPFSFSRWWLISLFIPHFSTSLQPLSCRYVSLSPLFHLLYRSLTPLLHLKVLLRRPLSHRTYLPLFDWDLLLLYCFSPTTS